MVNRILAKLFLLFSYQRKIVNSHWISRFISPKFFRVLNRPISRSKTANLFAVYLKLKLFEFPNISKFSFFNFRGLFKFVLPKRGPSTANFYQNSSQFVNWKSSFMIENKIFNFVVFEFWRVFICFDLPNLTADLNQNSPIFENKNWKWSFFKTLWMYRRKYLLRLILSLAFHNTDSHLYSWEIHTR